MIKAVLFDLDGTLIDSLPLIRYSFKKVFDHMGIPWDGGRVMSTVGLPLREVAREYAGEGQNVFFDLYIKYQLEKHDEYIKLFPRTREMLESVRERGLKTGIVTSKRRGMAERAVSLVSIGHLIDCLVALEDCRAHKPDPLPVFTALKAIGAAAEEAVFVGDSWYDMESGRAAGVVTVGVTWGMADRSRLAGKATGFIADSWDDFLYFIEQYKG